MQVNDLTDMVAAVQVRSRSSVAWETIAAFNNWDVAVRYARDCRRSTDLYQYRTVPVAP